MTVVVFPFIPVSGWGAQDDTIKGEWFWVKMKLC